MKLGSIQDVKVPAQVVLGSADLSLGELSQLAVGSIIELRSLAGEPVDLVVAGEVVARGEVVVIDENFGIRLTKLVEEGR
jgi:flagellar motor switch protein FliN/FliY